MHPFVLILRGPLGVGKSTIAAVLAERWSGVPVSVDAILTEPEFDAHALHPDAPGIPLAWFLRANALIAERIAAPLAHGRPAIVDGNFYFREAIDDLITRLAPMPVLVATLTASLSTCIARDQQRTPSYGVDAATVVYQRTQVVSVGHRIDTEGKSIATTIEAITAFVEREHARHP